jgi:hypothetical protein
MNIIDDKTFSCRFSTGIELASFVTSSTILCKSWKTISSDSFEDGVGISWKLDKETGSDFTILAFKANLDDDSNVQADLISSSELKEDNFLHFEFLCTKRIPIFSLNRTAVSLFRDNHHQLEKLKTEVHLILDLFDYLFDFSL